MKKIILGLIIVLWPIGFHLIVNSTTANANTPAEMRCNEIKWYIGKRLHKSGGQNDLYKDQTVRCENKESICYIYHGSLSCFGK